MAETTRFAGPPQNPIAPPDGRAKTHTFARCWVAQALRLALMAAACLATLPARAQSAPDAATGLQLAASIEQSMVAAIGEAEKSVVAIARIRRNDAEGGPAGPLFDPFGQQATTNEESDPSQPGFIPTDFGTGVVVDRSGLVLTCNHVLGDSDNSIYRVTTIDRRTYNAKVKASDTRSDLAVLQLEDASGLTPIKFGNGAALRKGQIVIALGNPYAIARDGQASASWGIVANLSRKAAPGAKDESQRPRSTLHHYGTLIQTDAKLNLGTSGGALVNLKGEMVGLTTALAAIVGYEQSAGYAVPVDETFLRVLEDLKQGREVQYGLLGILPNNLSADDIRGGRQGALVTGVQVGTPAQRFLEPEDVITAVNGQPVFDADSLVLNVGRLEAGATAALNIERGGRQMRVAVELAKFPVAGKRVFTPEPAWRGLRVDYKTALLDQAAGVIPPEDCVVVIDVASDSSAWNAGLRPGMYISHVDGRPVRNPRDFREAVADKSAPVRVLLPLGTDSERTRVIAP
ncbi:MAG: PDZ domain-containing protein [Pirellulales bacterium]|nr:PDZ domain-containing protein [Pirellulales bacterium]